MKSAVNDTPLVYHISKIDGCDHVVLGIIISEAFKVEGSVHDIFDGSIPCTKYFSPPKLSTQLLYTQSKPCGKVQVNKAKIL